MICLHLWSYAEKRICRRSLKETALRRNLTPTLLCLQSTTDASSSSSFKQADGNLWRIQGAVRERHSGIKWYVILLNEQIGNTERFFFFFFFFFRNAITVQWNEKRVQLKHSSMSVIYLRIELNNCHCWNVNREFTVLNRMKVQQISLEELLDSHWTLKFDDFLFLEDRRGKGLYSILLIL